MPAARLHHTIELVYAIATASTRDAGSPTPIRYEAGRPEGDRPQLQLREAFRGVAPLLINHQFRNHRNREQQCVAHSQIEVTYLYHCTMPSMIDRCVWASRVDMPAAVRSTA